MRKSNVKSVVIVQSRTPRSRVPLKQNERESDDCINDAFNKVMAAYTTIVLP
jgi:hypothetical protein